ncbi:unnamed protein product [Chrysodeixis includens]|uniref:Protein Wnt n=1 Tax=Chrysodeixis includens TaxID=689277 RepID=A0A9N8L7L0_CHRIL|nr:unnamed protein product [Chrysodeixis includens]
MTQGSAITSLAIFEGRRNLAAPRPATQTGNTSLETFTALHKENCHRLEYLVERQKQLCMLSDTMIKVLQTGAQQSVEECQHQFRHSRWNCSTVENSTDIFGGVLKFNVDSCGGVDYYFKFDNSLLNEDDLGRLLKVKDIRYGEMFSKDFSDSKEDKTTDEGLVNLHNNEAGRRVVERKRGKNIRKLRPLHMDMKKPNKTDLVYLEDSPDYCEPNDE